MAVLVVETVVESDGAEIERGEVDDARADAGTAFDEEEGEEALAATVNEEE